MTDMTRDEKIEGLAKLANHVNIWLKAALDCTNFNWSQDQKLYAQQAANELDAFINAQGIDSTQKGKR